MTIEQIKEYIKKQIMVCNENSDYWGVELEGQSYAYSDCLSLLMDWNGK